MNQFMYIGLLILGFVVVNVIFSLIPYIVPRVPPIMIQFQLFFNVMLFFAIVLPRVVGQFKILFK
jgi:hypothetical protein